MHTCIHAYIIFLCTLCSFQRCPSKFRFLSQNCLHAVWPQCSVHHSPKLSWTLDSSTRNTRSSLLSEHSAQGWGAFSAPWSARAVITLSPLGSGTVGIGRWPAACRTALKTTARSRQVVSTSTASCSSLMFSCLFTLLSFIPPALPERAGPIRML